MRSTKRREGEKKSYRNLVSPRSPARLAGQFLIGAHKLNLAGRENSKGRDANAEALRQRLAGKEGGELDEVGVEEAEVGVAQEEENETKGGQTNGQYVCYVNVCLAEFLSVGRGTGGWHLNRDDALIPGLGRMRENFVFS